jgi:glycosyltransferase involved in cell wall biosynthesis
MKISLLHYSAPPIVGGVESVIEHHARLMANDGHQVQVVAGRGAQFDPRVQFIHIPLLDSRHEEVLELKTELDQGTVSDRFKQLTSRMETELRKVLSNTDVLIAHNVCSLHKNLALTAALFNISKEDGKMRTILWHHDLAWTTPRYQAELHPGHPWDLLKTPWPKVKQVVVSDLREDELAGLMNLDRASITVVPNGVDLERFHKLEDQTCFYVQKLSLLEASPLLLLPVRITPRKNIELALHVLASLRADMPSAQMIVTGPLGPHNPANVEYLGTLRKLRHELGLTGAAHFLAELSDEFIPDAVISDLYQLADILLFPSYEEGFGIPVLEAGLARLPVFCSDIPPLRKLGGEFANYFSPEANPAKVAADIQEFLQASSTFKLRQRVRSEYIWQQVYRKEIVPLLQGKEA